MDFDWSLMVGRELTIEREIDVMDIDKSIKIIEATQRQIEQAVQIGIENATSKIIDKLESLMDDYGVSGLKKDIRVNSFHLGFEIEVEGFVAIFVENGTGIKGEWTPHPVDPWDYDINDHNVKGWVYLGEDGKYRRTLGMPSRPYFYHLVEWIRSYGIIAREINKMLRRLK